MAMSAFFLPMRRASRQDRAAGQVFFDRLAAHAAGTSASASHGYDGLVRPERCLPERRPCSINATDIPGFSMSSGGAVPVRPGRFLVVAGSGLQAAVQDADEAVGELT
jgi:hypothetical protein